MGVQVDGDQMRNLKFGAESCRLALHVFDQFGTLDAFGPAWKILHQRGNRELAARLVALQHKRLEIGAGSVDGGCQAGASGAQNNGIASF